MRAFPQSGIKHWPLVVLLGAVYLCFHPILSAQFSIIGDHAIAELTGWGFHEQHFLLKFKTADFLQRNGRFLPLYWMIHFFEAYLFGFDALLWRVGSLLLALLTAAALYRCINLFLKPLASALCAFLFFTPLTSVLYIQIGHPEAFGILLFLVGLGWLLEECNLGRYQPQHNFVALSLMALTGFIKESFIPLLPFTLVFLYGVYPSILKMVFPSTKGKIISFKEYLFLGLPLVLSITQMVGVFYSIYYYGNSYFPHEGPFVTSNRQTLINLLSHCVWIVPLAFILLNQIRLPKYLWWGLKEISLVTGFLLVFLIVPQWLMYRERLFLDDRFFALAALGFLGCLVILLWFLSLDYNERLLRRAYHGILVGLFILSGYSGAKIYERAKGEKLNTATFQKELKTVMALKQKQPDKPIVFCSDLKNEEQVISVSRYLSAFNKTLIHPYLRLEVPAPEVKLNAPDRKMMWLATNASRFFDPISRLHANYKNCIGVYFSGKKEACQCPETVTITNLLDAPKKS